MTTELRDEIPKDLQIGFGDSSSGARPARHRASLQRLVPGGRAAHDLQQSGLREWREPG